MSCGCNKISGMKKKHKIGKGNTDDVWSAIIAAGVAAPIGAVASSYTKGFVMPMIYKDTDTADQKKTTDAIGNGVGIAVGIGIAALSHYSDDNMVKAAIVGFGSGFAADCATSLVKIYMPATAINAPMWQGKIYRPNPKPQMMGADNGSLGIMGADNGSLGIMRPIPNYQQPVNVGKQIPMYQQPVSVKSSVSYMM